MKKVIRKILDNALKLEKKMKNIKRVKNAKRFLRTINQPYRLHLGCGTVRFEGWLNIDIGSNKAKDLELDITWPLPFESDSCEYIYTEHMLEHLDVDQGLNFLRECYRVLKPGGVIRIAIPSLDILIKRSYEGNWNDADWLKWPEFQYIKSRAEMLNIAFRSWGHKWLYDREELHRRLQEAGFTNVVDCNWQKSDHHELEGRETRKDSLLICEATK